MKIENKIDIIKRLMREADLGIQSKITAIESLEFRRDQYGLTQMEFAKILKMQSSHYSEFVKGKRELPKAAIRRAVAIGVPPNCALKI